MKQNYLIGITLIAFGFYLLLVKLNIIIAFDFMLLIALAFLGGYIYRRSVGDKNAGGLLLVGNILTGIFLSNHLGGWVSDLPGLELLAQLDTVFYIGLAFLGTWLIENMAQDQSFRRQRGFLLLGGFLTLIGGYDVALTALNISPSVIRNMMFPLIFIGIGLMVLLSSGKKNWL